MKKKIFVIAMILCMVLTMLPTVAFAADPVGDTNQELKEEKSQSSRAMLGLCKIHNRAL